MLAFNVTYLNVYCVYFIFEHLQFIFTWDIGRKSFKQQIRSSFDSSCHSQPNETFFDLLQATLNTPVPIWTMSKRVYVKVWPKWPADWVHWPAESWHRFKINMAARVGNRNYTNTMFLIKKNIAIQYNEFNRIDDAPVENRTDQFFCYWKRRKKLYFQKVIHIALHSLYILFSNSYQFLLSYSAFFFGFISI